MADRPPPLAPGNYDRAWNDPPLFSYSGAPSSTGRTQLNKRVGFPAGGPTGLPVGDPASQPPRLHDAGAKPPPSMLVGPPLGELAPPPIGDNIHAGQSMINERELDIKTCDEVESILVGIAKKNFSTKKCEELVGRLSALFSGWINGTLSPRVMRLVSEISSLLERDSLGEADKKLVTLSADHGTEGNNMQWVLAVRHLLIKLRENEEGGDKQQAVTQPL